MVVFGGGAAPGQLRRFAAVEVVLEVQLGAPTKTEQLHESDSYHFAAPYIPVWGSKVVLLSVM